jgi:Pyruvate/2-oxoacid:ferredoxin oxidoreductase delta subunit
MVKPVNPPPLTHMPAYAVQPRSGNAINGLGIERPVRARHVFHTSPAYGHHEWLLLNRFFNAVVSFATFRQTLATRWWMRRLQGPTARIQRPISDPVAMAAEVKAKAVEFGAAIVGITRLTPGDQYEHADLQDLYPWAIAYGVPMDRAVMATVPSVASNTEVIRVYKELAKTGAKLSEWLRAQGWKTTGYADPGSTDLLQIPIAIRAGLGELGKHGSLICRDFGSNIRLGTVITEIPLAADVTVDIGVEDLCASCRRCTIDCPPAAISDAKQWVRGEKKWYVDFDKCAPYFSIAGGCAICFQVCPWAEDGRGPILSEQLLKKRAAKSRKALAPVAEKS